MSVREHFFKVVKLRDRERPSARKLGRASLKLASRSKVEINFQASRVRAPVSRHEASKKKEHGEERREEMALLKVDGR